MPATSMCSKGELPDVAHPNMFSLRELNKLGELRTFAVGEL